MYVHPIRYYGETVPANKAGEMAGRRTVREWDPATGNKHTWHETLDQSANIRQVRPELNNGAKKHYTFDKSGTIRGVGNVELSHSDIQNVFQDLIEGRISREDADRWVYPRM